VLTPQHSCVEAKALGGAACRNFPSLVCNPGGGDHQAGCWCLGSVTFEKRPLQLYMINNAYLLLALLLMGAVLAVWP
jgi:hypothetical protein